MGTFVRRADWGAAAPKNAPTPIHVAGHRGLAVHHSGSPADQRQSHQECASRVKGIQRYHQGSKGWNDIAYSWLVCQHGDTFEGRGLGVRTAAQGTDAGNDSWHAVCYLGDGAARSVGGELEQALVFCIGMVRRWAPAAVHVFPHLRFKATTCPGHLLREWCRQWP